MRRRLAVLALSLLLFASFATWAQDPMLNGTYVYVPEQSADIAATIEALVDKMNFIKRPFARNRLSKTNTAYQRIRITQPSAALEITFDDRKPIHLPANGTPIQWTREDGDRFEVAVERRDSNLVQTYRAADGTRVNTFRWDEDGKTLHLDVEVTSSQLPQPLKYSLVYRRLE